MKKFWKLCIKFVKTLEKFKILRKFYGNFFYNLEDKAEKILRKLWFLENLKNYWKIQKNGSLHLP